MQYIDSKLLASYQASSRRVESHTACQMRHRRQNSALPPFPPDITKSIPRQTKNLSTLLSLVLDSVYHG